MWLFTTSGFFSVTAYDEAGNVQIRARTKRDINNIRKIAQKEAPKDFRVTVVKTPWRDYPFRIILPYPLWTLVALHLADAVVDYMNFKEAVAETDKHRAGIYMAVWDYMQRRLQPQKRQICYKKK